MRMPKFPWIFFLCFIFLSGSWMRTSISRAAALPTEADLRAMYDAGQYHDCLRQIASLLALKGEAAKSVPTDKLLLLRAHCNIQVGNANGALKTFQTVANAADPDLALEGRAGVILLQNSKALVYRQPGKTPLDLKTDEGWKGAARALFDQQYDAAKNSIDAAQSAQQLPPIMNVLGTRADLTALDRAAGGDGSRIAPQVDKIDQRARDLIVRELNNCQNETTKLEARADEQIPLRRGERALGLSDRRGLQDAELDRLAQIIDTASMAYRAALAGQEAARVLAKSTDAWQSVIDLAFTTGQHAQMVLDEG